MFFKINTKVWLGEQYIYARVGSGCRACVWPGGLAISLKVFLVHTAHPRISRRFELGYKVPLIEMTPVHPLVGVHIIKDCDSVALGYTGSAVEAVAVLVLDPKVHR